jgi:hypothetical protein
MAIDQQPPSGPHAWGGQPQAYYAVPAYVVPTSGTAVASLVCSLVGLITFGLGAIPGVICGHMALPETRSGSRGGHGLAVAGLIIGWIQCGGWALFWMITIVGAVVGAAHP